MEKIGKYEIISVLGKGGMGIVYKALDTKIDRVLALKTLSARLDSEPELRRRFQREARSAAKLSHRNIITIYDYDEVDGLAYIAMEYLDGQDLKRIIADGRPISLPRKLSILTEVCEGLAHAHRMGIVHRDVKPGNIFVTRKGEVKLLDFGLARIAASDLTRSGISVGTPSYMAPEQIRGEKVDHRSDIFSLGAVCYEFLTHQKPFQGDSDFAISYNVVQSDPQRVDVLDPSIPLGLAAIVHRALSKEPSARYQSMDDLLRDLAQSGSAAEDETVFAPLDETRIEEISPAQEEATEMVDSTGLTEARSSLPPPDLTEASRQGNQEAAPLPLLAGESPRAEVRPAARIPPAIPPAETSSRILLWTTAGVLGIFLVIAGAYLLRSDPSSAARPPAPVAPLTEPLEPAEAPQQAVIPESSASRSARSEEPPARPAPESRRVAEKAADPVERVAGQRKAADDARTRMEQAKLAAQASRAAELAPGITESARQAEARAGRAYEERQFSQAAYSFVEAQEAYSSALNQAQREAARLAELDRKKKEQEAIAERRAKDAEEMGRQAAASFKQGMYPQAQTAVEQALALDPQNSSARQLRDLLIQMQTHVQEFNSAYSRKDYPEALNAILRAEKLNPSDPTFAALRQRVIAEASPGKPRLPPTLDKEAAIRRRQGEEIYPIPVQHLHRLGSCAGELVFVGTAVQFRPNEPGHEFRAPVKDVSLKVEAEKIQLVNERDGRELESFRAEDAPQAQTFKRMWDQVKQKSRAN